VRLKVSAEHAQVRNFRLVRTYGMPPRLNLSSTSVPLSALPELLVPGVLVACAARCENVRAWHLVVNPGSASICRHLSSPAFVIRMHHVPRKLLIRQSRHSVQRGAHRPCRRSGPTK
jgi:hypothetical protein